MHKLQMFCTLSCTTISTLDVMYVAMLYQRILEASTANCYSNSNLHGLWLQLSNEINYDMIAVAMIEVTVCRLMCTGTTDYINYIAT